MAVMSRVACAALLALLVMPAVALGQSLDEREFATLLGQARSEEHTSELQSPCNLVCRLLLEKKKSGDREVRARTTLEALMLLPDATLAPFFTDFLLPGAASVLTAFNLLPPVTEDELRGIARHVPRERLVALTTELLEDPREGGKRLRLLEAVTLTLERGAEPGASPAGPALPPHKEPLLLQLRPEIHGPRPPHGPPP